MSLKDTARTVAALDTLHKAIGDHLKAGKHELEAGLKAAKAETGTQKISISLDDNGPDIGSVSLVQPKAAAAVTDPEAFAAWVVSFGDRFKSEIERKFVTSVRPVFQKMILDQVTAAGVAEWADPETGVIHEVPGVAMSGRAAYTRMTITDVGKAAIPQAWREGRLASVLPDIAPAAIESGDGEAEQLRAKVADLEKRLEWLNALEAAGVDNWGGIEVAIEMYNGGAE
ncbi:hypothetical protein [Streptomyces sp. DSM 40750]|uniref:hypothetical protein n=1 Tax=Streptomyces sp. DSM 40750 TaxID=2801030 RepID=UPI00214AA7D7|nr:hypothetical protein [Streptomyces sp. DSM 40750]UUU21678.1 hypothetical protein JIX55_15850 [Streptomyces sp. DSM 40750]